MIILFGFGVLDPYWVNVMSTFDTGVEYAISQRGKRTTRCTIISVADELQFKLYKNIKDVRDRSVDGVSSMFTDKAGFDKVFFFQRSKLFFFL